MTFQIGIHGNVILVVWVKSGIFATQGMLAIRDIVVFNETQLREWIFMTSLLQPVTIITVLLMCVYCITYDPSKQKRSVCPGDVIDISTNQKHHLYHRFNHQTGKMSSLVPLSLAFLHTLMIF